jgi:PAS domain S-box-containing protein
MSLSTFTVLMVEDLATDRELYRRALCQDSTCVYELLEAESLAAGLALCQTRSIDAVLLDFQLPDGNGLDFLSELSVQSNGRMPPVVMMTGQGNESTAVRAIKLGAEDYVVKSDLTPDLLQLKVRRAIESSRRRQQQVELSLQAANQQITTIWESMTDAYTTLDRDWRLVYANPAATEIYRQMLGSATAEFLGRTYWEVFPWSVGTIVEQEYRRAVTDRVAVHFELFYQPSETWFEVHAYPSDVGLGIYFQDINQRQRAELARLAAEQERDRFFNLSLDLLVVATFEGNFVRVNPACERILGFTSTELIGQNYLEFVHPEDRAATVAIVADLNAGNVLTNFEDRYRCKDGSYRWLSWSVMPDIDRKLLYVNAHDITERKQAASLLQAQQATIQQQLGEIESIYQMAPVGLCFVDTDFRYVRINEQLAQINGLSVAEHIGKTFREVLPELVNTMEPVYRQVIESGEPIIDLEVTGTNRAQPGVERCWLASFYP